MTFAAFICPSRPDRNHVHYGHVNPTTPPTATCLVRRTTERRCGLNVCARRLIKPAHAVNRHGQFGVKRTAASYNGRNLPYRNIRTGGRTGVQPATTLDDGRSSGAPTVCHTGVADGGDATCWGGHATGIPLRPTAAPFASDHTDPSTRPNCSQRPQRLVGVGWAASDALYHAPTQPLS